MGNWRRSALFYVGLSTSLAAAGVLFAYFVSLPAAINFLTGFSVNHIQAMLTADSYLSFVATYLLGAALLFQIPLLLLIINTMTPLKPSKLMKLQKFVVVGAFILGAIISPTPDIMNQAFLAIPVIAMYQLGVAMVWLQNKLRARKVRARPLPQEPGQDGDVIPAALLDELRAPVKPVAPLPRATPVKVQPSRPAQRPAMQPRVFSDIGPQRVQAQPVATPRPAASIARPARPAPPLTVPARSIDGFSSYRPANAASAP